MKGSTATREGSMGDFSLGSSSLRLLRLRMKKNRAMRSEMKTTPPITPPMIGLLLMVVEELGEELVVLFEDVEDDASC